MDYYKNDYSQILEKLKQKTIAEFEKGPTPRNRLSAAFLLPSMLLLPPKLVDRLPTLAARSLDKEVEKLLYLCNEQLLSEVSNPRCETLEDLHLFFGQFPGEVDFITKDSLCLAYCLTHYSTEPNFPSGLSVLEDKLLHKFEVSGKIYNSYDSSFRKMGKRFDYIDNYIFLSLLLFARFKRQGCLKSFNAALKINDLLTTCEEEITDILSLCLSLLAFLRGEDLIRKSYESFVTGLPVD